MNKLDLSGVLDGSKLESSLMLTGPNLKPEQSLNPDVGFVLASAEDKRRRESKSINPGAGRLQA